MTKREHEALQRACNKYQEYSSEVDKAFKALQEMSGRLSGNRWCNAISNLEEIKNSLIATDKEKRRADGLYQDYWEAMGKQTAIEEVMKTLAELDFWKAH